VTAKKGDPAIAEIPVVAISADSSPVATAIRAESYIPKPFDANDLVGAVGRVLLDADRRKLARRLDERERLALLGMIAAGVSHEINDSLGMATLGVSLIEQTNASMQERMRTGSAPDRILASFKEPLMRIQEQAHDCRGDLERIRLIVRHLSAISRRAGDERALLDVGALLESVVSMALAELNPRILLVRQYEQGA